MIKTYYPNPFRYRKLKTLNNQDEIFEEVRQKIKPFLTNTFSEIQEYIDECGNLKQEIRLVRIVREKVKEKLDIIIFNKSNFFTKPIIKQIKKIHNNEDFQKNLRYLDLPVQPLTDKKGFEIQALSNELIEQAIEEIEDGFTYIYEYCTDYFPDPIEMWTDEAILDPNNFPFIAHDDFLEASYEVFDKIFEDLQKGSISLFNWVVSGDINTRLLKILKPRLLFIKPSHVLIVLESLISLIILLLLVKYVISNSHLLLNIKIEDKKLSDFSARKIVGKIRKDLSFNKIVIEEKTTKLLSKVSRLNSNMSFKYLNLKYKFLRLIINKNTI